MHLKELTLFSKNIDLQAGFYQSILGLHLTERTEHSVQFLAGTTKLNFVQKDGATPYHFAFNIPSNKVEEAREWLKKRVDILSFEGKEIIDFKNWNAHAMYFYDPDKNIGELIARHNLKVKTDQPFGPQQILSVSEIGIPCFDIEAVYRFFYQLFPIPVYDGNFDRFCAMGDEDVLFIVIDKKTKPDWFPTFDTAYSSDFLATIAANGQEWKIAFEKEKLILLK